MKQQRGMAGCLTIKISPMLCDDDYNKTAVLWRNGLHLITPSLY